MSQLMERAEELARGRLKHVIDFTTMLDKETRQSWFGGLFQAVPYLIKLGAGSDTGGSVQVVAAVTTNTIAGLSDKSWASVTSALSENQVLEEVGNEIHRSGQVMEDRGASFFKRTDPDPAATSKVASWFADLVQDDDVINSTDIDIPARAADVVACSSARLSSRHSASVVVRRSEEKLGIIEIGVLRYPGFRHPHFKVYRIKLTTWATYGRVMGAVSNKNRIFGEFTVRKYKPRNHLAGVLSEDERRQAIEKARATVSIANGRRARMVPRWTFLQRDFRDSTEGDETSPVEDGAE